MRSLIGLIALSLAALAPVSKAEESPDEFVKWARARAVPLHELDVASVSAVVGAAQVVALGEPAHGAHEPLEFRNRFFRHLVERLEFTAIALESGLTEARLANDFVMGGRGDVREIARNALTWGFGEYAENVELLRWMRQYNADPAHPRKVRFYGMDLSGAGSDGQFSSTRIALDEALSYLARVAPNPSRDTRRAVEHFLQRFRHDEYRSLSIDQRAQLRAALAGIVAFFDRERGALVTASSADDYEWARRNAIVATQIEELFRLWPADTPSEGISPQLHEAVAARDAAMADNVQWIREREGSSGRVLVFAHNAHVMNARLRGGIWDVYPQAPIAMGQHLRAALGRNLLIIGTSSAANGPDLPAATERGGSLDTALAGVGLEHFLLDIRQAKQAPSLLPWLDQQQSMRANFTTHIVLPLRDAFDAVAFIDQLTPAAASK